MAEDRFFSRDLSWLSFNDRILMEAAKDTVPLVERLKFLSIFSSNLDEFYRVRIPLLLARRSLSPTSGEPTGVPDAETEFAVSREIIRGQQQRFGAVLKNNLLPALAARGVHWIYDQPVPAIISREVEDHFYAAVAPFLHPVALNLGSDFFAESNRLYLLVIPDPAAGSLPVVVNIPAGERPRFFSTVCSGNRYILFLDDIIREKLPILFPRQSLPAAYAFKVTRDAALNLEDELPDTLADQIEHLLVNRDGGLASRLLYQGGMPLRHLQLLAGLCKIPLSAAVEGGRYHNLKDMIDLPAPAGQDNYPESPFIHLQPVPEGGSLFDRLARGDVVLHPPYHSYDPVLRFFSEAAIDPGVETIFVTLYRIATDSKIAHALISAVQNGKKVQVFMELKARFDEANNLQWAKKMKAAGIQVIYSIPKLKVHAKLALVKRREEGRDRYYALLSTGNLNEVTARFYTDHVLLTAHKGIAREIELLFIFLARRRRPEDPGMIPFQFLLVAQFNLQSRFLALIDREIAHARAGLPAGIRIKLNNLEEPVMIEKLYEASRAGVPVRLIVRSICCLVPGVAGQSENIRVTRIVGRFLEHGRIFLFSNNGAPELYLGSADWMNRNIHTRIETCFPITDAAIGAELIQMFDWQLADNVQAVIIDAMGDNVPVEKATGDAAIDAQAMIYSWLKDKAVAGAGTTDQNLPT